MRFQGTDSVSPNQVEAFARYKLTAQRRNRVPAEQLFICLPAAFEYMWHEFVNIYIYIDIWFDGNIKLVA